MPMPAPDLARIFTPGLSFPYEWGGTGTVSLAAGGELWLPTGRLVACDPFVALGSGEAEPFTAAVPPGRYPVDLSVVTITRPGEPPTGTPHRRVAAARLAVRAEPPVTWELALVPGQDAAELADGEFYGYGVDAGTGCFYDAACDDSFPAREDDEGPLWDAFEAADWAPGPYTITDPDTGHNVVAFSSGWGDGAYPTWVGRTARGDITCFVTDFFVVPPESGPAPG
ncbi:DUF4241 domain-containing protein [Streptomyces sp. HMX112]|uniref:DUF4241 domain-containing protein n=1 Tax=Streptomyces sp. HMX112 TaxID=3390850 RepID=UPI003A7FE5FD